MLNRKQITLVELLFLLATISLPGNGQDCSGSLNCGDCIGRAGCSWCSTINFQGSQRCVPTSNLTAENCNDIQNPDGGLDGRMDSVPPNPVSITNINLRLRVGVPQVFTVTVTPLRNLPLDLYVLIDLSASMSDELDALKEVAGSIANRIGVVTNNTRIGFGSFNDKVTRPYTRVTVARPGDVCDVPSCDPNYAFIHRITITGDITFFDRTLQNVNVTSNVDNPENGLEGLAQVVTCEDIIGWRDRGATGIDRGLTRVVLFMTDDAFHYSGEGQLAGILTPYNGECLLDPSTDTSPARSAEFTRWREVDYPSVGQIVQLLQENEVAVIFAVTEQRRRNYQNLADLINLRSRASVSQLEDDANSILTLIETEYRQFLQGVGLVADDSDLLDITIEAMCPDGTTAMPSGRGCEGVQLDQGVDFRVSVTLNSCDNLMPQPHRVVATGFGEFTITYTGECECPCASNLVRPNPSERCNRNGDFVCGVCECYPGWCGLNCELMIGGNRTAGQGCPRGGPDNEQCSGPDRGVCGCDCECIGSFFGPACECDRNGDCPTDANGLLCSGQGECCDGSCRCLENYRHNGSRLDCSCRPEAEVCVDVADSDRKVCNGNGTCGCDSCKCQEGFFGQYCQACDIDTCGHPMDLECIRRCIESGFDNATCRSCECMRPLLPTNADIDQELNMRQFLVDLVTTSFGASMYDSELDCRASIDNCVYNYFLVRGPGMYVLVLEREPDCVGASGISLPFPPWVFAPIIIAVLLILGIIIFVLIRVIISILDYLEVKRWEKETQGADFSKNQNPLYQSPEMKYENVAYGRE